MRADALRAGVLGVLALAAAALALAQAPQPSSGKSLSAMPSGVFRMAVLGLPAGPCAAAPAAPAGLKAYADHIAKRLGRAVEICPAADLPAAAGMLAQGGVDIAPVDRASFAPIAAVARPTLTVRGADNLGRVQTVVIVKAAAAAAGLGDLAAARLAYAGTAPFQQAKPAEALADHGLAAAALAGAAALDGPEAGAAALRSGEIDALVLHSAAWQRLCRPAKAGDKPCADLKEIFRGRPFADAAWAVRRDMPEMLRMQLIGMHVPLHLENPEGFKWLAPEGREIEPIEATGLGVGA